MPNRHHKFRTAQFLRRVDAFWSSKPYKPTTRTRPVKCISCKENPPGSYSSDHQNSGLCIECGKIADETRKTIRGKNDTRR